MGIDVAWAGNITAEVGLFGEHGRRVVGDGEAKTSLLTSIWSSSADTPRFRGDFNADHPARQGRPNR